MDNNKQPLGISIFGGLNCFVFGFFFAAIFITTYLKTTPQDLNTITTLFKSKGFAVQITYRQFKILNIIYIITSCVLAASGAGLLLKREWARKVTVLGSFAWLALISLAAILNSALITQLIVYCFYPGALVIYFTNKKVENYFRTQITADKETRINN
ncbi:MAG: hypothetical protein PHQ96_02785 [Candidatus Omnitrophica bacterium]|nr:hypothetical protein [Candidatus Omnitrophota bacterium]